jgi:predicted peptidase
MSQQPFSLERNIVTPVHLEYLRYLPPDYGKEPGKKWPLILFLHGAGERGEFVDAVRIHGIARVVGERDIPFVTLSPQCPPNHWWSDFLPALDALVQNAIDTLDVDPNRVYLTGLSMGGFGTWHMAVEYPQRFAAIAPICGGGLWAYGFPERVSAIAHLPTWVFHGAKDSVVPLQSSQVLVDQLKSCGGDVRFTIYPEADHDSWTETYNNPELYSWFLSHSKAG